MRYTYRGYTDIGGRENNEDYFLCIKSKHGYLFVVADGLGGHGKGEIASFTAIEELKRQFQTLEKFDLRTAISDANLLILKKQEETGIKMKTTVAAVWISKEKAQFAHVGDSRIYAFCGSELVYQTQDHSAAQMALYLDNSIGDVRDNEERNVLTRALGVSDEILVELAELEANQYDRLLLCSDGFWEYVLEYEMCKTISRLQTPGRWIKKMRNILRSRVSSENDNNTAIAVLKWRV